VENFDGEIELLHFAPTPAAPARASEFAGAIL
jgi:hypothetical protein